MGRFRRTRIRSNEYAQRHKYTAAAAIFAAKYRRNSKSCGTNGLQTDPKCGRLHSDRPSCRITRCSAAAWHQPSNCDYTRHFPKPDAHRVSNLMISALSFLAVADISADYQAAAPNRPRSSRSWPGTTCRTTRPCSKRCAIAASRSLVSCRPRPRYLPGRRPEGDRLRPARRRLRLDKGRSPKWPASA